MRALLLFFLAMPAWGSDTHLTWTMPTHNIDGSPAVDLAGFKVYWGLESRVYLHEATVPCVAVGPPSTCDTTGLFMPANLFVDGETYYFSVTAYNEDGIESAYSNEATKFMSLPSETPASFILQIE